MASQTGAAGRVRRPGMNVAFEIITYMCGRDGEGGAAGCPGNVHVNQVNMGRSLTRRARGRDAFNHFLINKYV